MTSSARDACAAPEVSARERAYQHIQRKIASGELAAGGAVSEVALARELGTSRSPIREAIGQLAAEGLLDQAPNRGAVVVQLTRQDIIDLFELREALEVFAVGKAARTQIRPAEIDHLQSVCDGILDIKKDLERGGGTRLNDAQMHDFMASDLGFHALLIRLAENARILKVVNETRLLIRIFGMRHRGHRAAELERIHSQHAGVLRAVAEGDPESAMRLLANHIRTSRQERLDEFDRWEREKSLLASVPAVFEIHRA